MIDLTEQQHAIVNHNYGPALVFAVAGAGKTTTMVHRIERLVREKVFLPRQILATSFNRAAAGEIRAKLRQWRYCEPVKATTLHALGYSIIRRAVQQRYLPPVRVLDKAESLLYETLREVRRREYWFKEELEQLDKDDFLNYVGRCKGNLHYANLKQARLPASGVQLARQAKAPSRSLSWYVDLYELFEELRVRNQWITFDDMLLTGWECLIRHPEILSYVQTLFQSVLVDEFQDINYVQSEILDLMVASHRNYMAIGDDDQTIYEWRGAKPDFILSFKERYKAKTYLIHDNFRCAAPQIVLANEVIQHNKKRVKKHLSLTQGFCGEVFLNMEEQEEMMAYNLVEDIKLALDSGVPPTDLVILIRLYAQTPYIEQFLISKQIPYLIVGNVPFYRRPEVVTLINYCRVAMIEEKLRQGQKLTIQEVEQFSKAWQNIYNRPKRYISRKLSEKVRHAVVLHHAPLERVLAMMSGEVSYWMASKVRKIARDIAWLADNLNRPAQMILKRLEERLDYVEFLMETSGFPETAAGKAATVEAFINYSYKKGNVYEFIQHLEEISFGQLHTNNQYGADTSHFVKLMTIFRAKGLEWDAVFVPHCTMGTIPFGGNPDGREEERRLLYVAITRSRQDLYLYWTPPLSPFLEDIRVEKMVKSVEKLKALLTSDPQGWEPETISFIANKVYDFKFERFIERWWSESDTLKEKAAKRIIEFNQTAPTDDNKIESAALSFWQTLLEREQT